MHSNHHESARRTPLQATVSLAVLSALLLVTLVAACGSGGGSAGGGSSDSLGFGSPTAQQQAQLPATPADIPSGPPQCTGSADTFTPVPASLSPLVSACASQSGDEMVVTNLSQFVLDISPANGTSVQLQPGQYDTSAGLLPAGDELEVTEQNAAVAELAPSDPSTVLLPVGGQVIATSDQPVQLTVQVDSSASAASYGAELMTSYVVDNLTENGIGSYYDSIANCVNDAYSLWQKLYQQPPPSADDLIQQALQTYGSCLELNRKLTEDLAAEHPDSQGLQPDLATVAEGAREPNWESKSASVDNVDADIVIR